MTDSIISVQGLGKRYAIGHEVRYDTLRDRLSGACRHWARRILGRTGADPAREEFWALREVGFEVNRGEVLGIIGRNGAGKSTLLKILSRITEPTAGRITLRGRVASLLEVGTGFHPELSGRENIFLNGAILGMSRAEIRRKFDEIVAFAEVERFLDTPVKRYSSGMYVRLAFAVAAHLEPEILIVDEVLSVGDLEFQKKCLGKMQDISRGEGRTVLFVSHNIGAVSNLCSRCLLLQNGRLVDDGPANRVIDRYVESGASASGEPLALGALGQDRDSPIQLIDVQFNSGGPLVHREPFHAVLRFRATRTLDAVGFGLGFSSLDGRRLVTLDSDYAGSFLGLPSAGQFTVRLDLARLDLIPGRYQLDIGSFGTGHRGYHYVAGAAIVGVEPGNATPPHLHGLNGDWRPPASWQLVQASHPS